jgi:hypothetical protein
MVKIVKTDDQKMRKNILEIRLVYSTRFFEKIIETFGIERKELELRFRRLGENPDPDRVYWLEEEAANLNMFLAESAEIILVAIYHWVERELKYMIHLLPGLSEITV